MPFRMLLSPDYISHLCPLPLDHSYLDTQSMRRDAASIELVVLDSALR